MQTVLFIVFPYLAVIAAVGAGLYRWFTNRYTYSSLSSQLLENNKLFWGSVPWHYGITLILLAHLFGWIFPGAAGYILGGPARLAVFELAGLALAFWTIFGLVVLIVRRLPTDSRTRAVTSGMDWVLLFFLLVQVLTGAAIALFDRWGSLWYLSTAVPWLRSLVTLSPDISTVAALPAMIQFHFIWGFATILLIPFSRLVHIFPLPIGYLWRPYQVVIWNRERRRSEAPMAARSTAAAGANDPPDDPPPDPPRAPVADPVDDPPGGPPAGPPDRSRRRLTQAGLLAGAVATGLVAVPSIGFLLGLRKKPMVWRTLGKVDEFTPGQTVEVSFVDPSPEPWAGVTAKTAAWLRRTDGGQFIAFSINCTHLGCPVRWLPSANLFMCPCHGGVFYNDGRVASGPPPTPLVRYPVRVQNGEVQILASPLPISTV
ncbi:MAG: respiratory nitrate reductase subunit gamma [Acidobacteriota bacterium]